MKDQKTDIKKTDMLPEEFLSAMRGLLEDEYEDFLRSFEEKPRKGLFFNMKKARPETIDELSKRWQLRKVDWASHGYEYDESVVRPGKSPYHDAGLFYIQEPSAMIAAEKADIREGDVVLDLCAAPGGKSSQAAQKAGLLISNEIIEKRARILSSNMERMGYDNVIVCSASPEELSGVFCGFFDRIIVDAPCSGEGMFRKDDTAIAEWSLENVDRCVARQRDILEAALTMLRPGGRIVYSTCTFEPYENKWQLRRFCDIHGDRLELKEFQQLFPHKVPGEGHFYGIMDDLGESPERKLPELWDTAARMKAAGIHVLRAGIEKGEQKRNRKTGEDRYEPSHAEAMKAGKSLIGSSFELCSEELALRYLGGESLRLSELSDADYRIQGDQGDMRVTFDGYPLGLGRLSGGMLKNKLPKGLRRA